MTFLPLVGPAAGEDDAGMHPYVIDRMVQERRQELARMADAARLVRAARLAGAAQAHRPRSLARAVAVLAAALGRVPPPPRGERAGGAVLRPCAETSTPP